MTTTIHPTFDVTWTEDGALSVRWSNQPQRDARLLEAKQQSQIEDLVRNLGEAEATKDLGDKKDSGINAARQKLGTALFDLIDGPARTLTHLRETSRTSGQPLNLTIRLFSRKSLALHPAAQWRWELVYDGEPLGVGLPVAVQLGDRQTHAPKKLPRSALRVMFMAYSPEGTSILDYEEEEDRILGALQEPIRRKKASVTVVEDGTLTELERRLKLGEHDILYLSGHGVLMPDGPRLMMETEVGDIDWVSPEALLRVLKKGHMPELVVIASCYSAGYRGDIPSFAAALVAGGVPSVMGWVQPVLDHIATQAAVDLFEQLSQGRAPVEAVRFIRETLSDYDEKAPRPTHAWSTLHLLTKDAQGFVLDPKQPALDEHQPGQEETYQYLGEGGRMRVLERGFVGRRRELQRVVRILRSGKDRDRHVGGLTIVGMKGVGKSCLAARAIARHRQDVSDTGVIVLHGLLEDASVLTAFEDLALQWEDDKAQGYLERPEEDVSRRLKRLLGGPWRQRPIVIILDDFEQNLEMRPNGKARIKPYTAELLRTLLPICRTGRPKVLMTTTADFDSLPGEDTALSEIYLGSFARSATRKLWSRGIHQELKNISPESWEELAERLGRNARVLDWARTLIAGRRPDEIEKITRQAGMELPSWKTGVVPSNESQHQLAQVFLRTLAFAQAEIDVGTDARTFIKRARVYDVAVPQVALEPLADGLSINLNQHLVALQNLGLLEVGRFYDQRGHRVSPLVEPLFDAPEPKRWHAVAADFWLQRLAANRISFEEIEMGWQHGLEAKKEEFVKPFARRLDITFTNKGLYRQNVGYAQRHHDSLKQSPSGLLWLGSALTQTGELRKGWELFQQGEQAFDRIELSKDELWIPTEAAQILYQLGSYTEAAERLERSLEIQARVHGTEEHPSVAASLHELARVLQAQGDLQGARERLERSLEIQARVHGTEEHPDVAASLHELAGVLQAQGDLQGARERLERSLEIQARVHGTEEHPSVAASLHALAGVLKAQGDLQGARERLERSLEIYNRVHRTEEHPSVAASLHALAGVLKAQGDLQGARERLERSLEIYNRVHRTEEHPSVAASLHELAGVLQAQGDLQGARERLERSLEIKARVHGTEEHPSVAASLHELARVLQAQGDLQGARERLERSLEIYNRVHRTEEHPSVAASLHELAGVLQAQGDLQGARERLERSLEIQARVHGTEEHPDVAASLHALAGVLKAQGDLQGARERLERSLEIQARVHGTEEHPDVAASLHALAGVLQAQGDLQGARERLERSLEIKARMHGTEEHPHVAASLHALAGVLQAQGDLQGARERLERSLEIKARMHGTEEHPHVAASLHSLARVLQAQGDLQGARERLERSLEIQARVHGTEEHPDVAASLLALAGVLKAQGDLQGARERLERSLEIYNRVHGTEEHPSVAASLHELARVLKAQGDLQGARERLERSLEIYNRVHETEEHPSVAASLHELARVLKAQGDLQGARERLERSLEIKARVHGTEEHPDVATSLDMMASIQTSEGDFTGAEQSYRRCLDIREHVYKTREHYMSAETEVSLGSLLLQTGKPEEGMKYLIHAHQVLAAQVPNHPYKSQLDEIFRDLASRT